jgi:hypothetical protein
MFGFLGQYLAASFPMPTILATALLYHPDRKVDIKDNHLGIKLIPMISTWDQVDPIFPVRMSQTYDGNIS